MKSTLLIVIIALLLVAGGYYWYSNYSASTLSTGVELTEPEPLMNTQQQKDNEASLPFQNQPGMSQLNAEQLEKNNQKLQIAKAKLDALLQEYNDNLSDPEERQRIQQQVDQLMKEYNELVLPAALAKIN